MTNESKETIVHFTLTSDDTLAKAVALVMLKAEKAGKGSYSVAYWTEQLLARGIDNFNTYLDNDAVRRDTQSYVKAKALIPTPPPLDMNDPATIQAHLAYAQADQTLMAKYHQGGTKASL